MTVRRHKWILLGPVLALLLLGHGFAAKWRGSSGVWPPDQMWWSEVDCDPKLTDPFFESNERNRPNYDAEVIPSDKRPKGLLGAKHTATCFSTSFGSKHLVNFCEVRLLDGNMIDLRIHQPPPGFYDNLRIQIRNGMFACDYWTRYKVRPRVGLTWTTNGNKSYVGNRHNRDGSNRSAPYDACIRNSDRALSE